jgi:hypothetical protein
VLSATQRDLKALGASDSPEGQIALTMARALDSGRSLMAAPAMAKQLEATLDKIRSRAPKQGDAVDDVLAAAREKRAANGVAGAKGLVRTTKRSNERR